MIKNEKDLESVKNDISHAIMFSSLSEVILNNCVFEVTGEKEQYKLIKEFLRCVNKKLSGVRDVFNPRFFTNEKYKSFIGKKIDLLKLWNAELEEYRKTGVLNFKPNYYPSRLAQIIVCKKCYHTSFYYMNDTATSDEKMTAEEFFGIIDEKNGKAKNPCARQIRDYNYMKNSNGDYLCGTCAHDDYFISAVSGRVFENSGKKIVKADEWQKESEALGRKGKYQKSNISFAIHKSEEKEIKNLELVYDNGSFALAKKNEVYTVKTYDIVVSMTCATGYKLIDETLHAKNVLSFIPSYEQNMIKNAISNRKKVESRSFLIDPAKKELRMIYSFAVAAVRTYNPDFNKFSEILDFLKSGKYALCARCHNFIAIENAENAQRGEYSGYLLCRSCIRATTPNPGRLNSYGTKYNTILDKSKFFQKKEKDKTLPELFYGLEVECNIKRDLDFDKTLQAVVDRLGGYVFAKRDGSLGSRGVELVSAPATFEKTREVWLNLFNRKYAKSTSENYACKELMAFSDHSTGTHIHISRAALTEDDICGIVYFINKKRAFCGRVAGRSYWNNSYSVSKQVDDGYQTTDEIRDNCLRIRSGHYDCVNLKNSETVEIRIFKSNMTLLALFRYIEFVDALVYFVKTFKNFSPEELTEENFKNFIKDKPRYRILNAFVSGK